jgi:hypothetical protein
MAMLLLGFAHAFHVLEHALDPDTFGTLGASVYTVYLMALGEFPEFSNDYTSMNYAVSLSATIIQPYHY